MQQRKDRNNNIRNGPRVHAMTVHSNNKTLTTTVLGTPERYRHRGNLSTSPRKGVLPPSLVHQCNSHPCAISAANPLGEVSYYPLYPHRFPVGDVYPRAMKFVIGLCGLFRQFSKLFSFPSVPAFRSITVCTIILKSTLKIAASLSLTKTVNQLRQFECKCISANLSQGSLRGDERIFNTERHEFMLKWC